jgi:colanic acid biosynthesis glycosyl transferase WcaI
VVTPAFREYLIEHWRLPAEKIAVVENGVETEVFSPQPDSANCALRHELGADDKFLVCYVGTMGMAHGLETLLDAAAQLRQQRPDVVFLLIGEGAEKARIKALAESRQLTNVRFLDQQPRERIPAFISASDACLVLLKKTDVFKTVIPTKMLEFMSCARPVIVAVEGQARKIVEEASAGIAIEPEDAGALVQAITGLADDQALRFDLGQNGRRYITERFSRAETAAKFADILKTYEL